MSSKTPAKECKINISGAYHTCWHLHTVTIVVRKTNLKFYWYFTNKGKFLYSRDMFLVWFRKTTSSRQRKNTLFCMKLIVNMRLLLNMNLFKYCCVWGGYFLDLLMKRNLFKHCCVRMRGWLFWDLMKRTRWICSPKRCYKGFTVSIYSIFLNLPPFTSIWTFEQLWKSWCCAFGKIERCRSRISDMIFQSIQDIFHISHISDIWQGLSIRENICLDVSRKIWRFTESIFSVTRR